MAWPKGVPRGPFTEEHKEAIRQAHLERSRIIAAVLERDRPDPEEQEQDEEES